MDKKYFWKEIVPKKIKNHINTGGGMGIFSCIVTAIMAIVIEPYMMVDAILVLVLALGILIGKSRVGAIVILIYYIFGQVTLLLEGMVKMPNVAMIVVFVMAYISAIRGTFAYHKLKKQYIENPESINVN